MSYPWDRYYFVHTAMNSGAWVEPHKLEGLGERLATDIAIFGPIKAPKVIIISSGIHGVELPMGSLLQRQWLEAAEEACHKDNQLRIVFAHALNPYGAAHTTRTDQNGVDPNRNFIDFDNPPPTSQSYAALAEAFAPQSLSIFAQTAAWKKLLTFALANGVHEFKQALVGGQYDFPNGLYYGGKEPSWTRQTWENIVQTHVLNPELEKVWHIDLHTGDGPYGKMQILVTANQNSPLHQTAKALGDKGQVRLTQRSFATLSGDIADFWPRLVPDTCEVTPIAIEVGTSTFPIEGLDVLHAMIARNALRALHNDNHPSADKIISTMQRKFAPDDKRWRDTVLDQGHMFWNRLIRQVSPQL